MVPALPHPAGNREQWIPGQRATLHPQYRRAAILGTMAKRIMISLVGAGIGSLAGLLVSFLGVGNLALILGAVAGAIIPLAVMGPPGR